MAAVSQRCCFGPPLKYCVQYVRSRHRCHFRYPPSNTLAGTLLFGPLLICGRQRGSCRSHCCRSTKWDTVNIFPPIMSDVVLPHLYYHCPCRPAYLLPSLSSPYLIILHIFCCPNSLPNLPHHCSCYLNLPNSTTPHQLASLSAVPVISFL